MKQNVQATSMVKTILYSMLMLGVSYVAAIQEQSDPLLQCKTPKLSNVRIAIRTRKNETGNWVSQIGVKQHLQSPEGETHQWLVDVEQNTETCEGGDSVLETLFYLSAPASPGGAGPTNPVSTGSTPNPTSWMWTCSRCPSCPSCPSCPLPSSTAQPPTTLPPITQPPTTTPKAAQVGYEFYVGMGYYKLHTESAVWTEARDTCKAEGAHLLVLNSDKERDVIESLLSFYTKVNYAEYQEYLHVGAYRIGTEYITVTGVKLDRSGYARWAPHEPSGGSEACLSVVRPNALYNDILCDMKLGFICEHLQKDEQ